MDTTMDISPITTGLKANTQPGQSELDVQLQRIRRIGKKLFDVANCVIRVKGVPNPQPMVLDSAMAALEEAFCDAIPISNEQLVAGDTRAVPALAQQKAVVGAPYIRFYAMQPLFDDEHAVIGAVHLVGYSARVFGDLEKQLFADLGSLVERELRLAAVNASQQDLLKKNRSLRRESLIDPVLGTWNRSAITRMLATEVERCYNDAKPLSLILADLESWQQIHTNYGHAVSDNVLIKFSSRLRSCIRPSDALGRYEGETFMVVLPGAANKTAHVIAERMRQAILGEPERVGDETIALTLAMGAVSTD
ncbi:MAG: sensor domain-containing diguanylate cyclase, partial [Burkholderiales bacterium]|nr:sensor domain-containing diguanylate cyclase [Burkholderiales bacterium]